MKEFLEKIAENCKNNPNTAVLFDEANTKGFSYTQLDELSGKVYAYLKQNNIGKEDFVLINLPRGVLPIIAWLGVWKAGAAFVLVEDNYAPERIAYIRNDCGCKLEINKDNWEKILECETLQGYEKTDEHDAAYAIYTSGTTGNPKGVLHEYGNLTRCMESIYVNGGKPLINAKDRGVILSPLNFIASIIVLMYVLYEGAGKVHIASYATIKNPLLLKKFFLEKMISITFLTPSYARMLSGQTGPFLKTLVVGSEPANNLYIKNVDIYNFYAMSESGFAVSIFPIDKSYETCPIGKPGFNLKYWLLDEDGNEVPKGQMGELCFENLYVRGYINLPEETKKAFINGVYHTGDLAQEDANGNLMLLGRKNDMIKINGNRIEPAEIEAAVKNTLGVNWVGVRGFEDEKQSFICAYYTEDIKLDLPKTRNELLKRLPYYMLPAYFIKIDNIPLKANGKFDRNGLPEPDVKNFKNEYVEPTNDVEKKLCNAFEKVLKLDKVGIRDDFYEMGGDSLSAMEVIVESELPGLNASEIFRGRTVEQIAKLYEELHKNDDDESDDVKNANAMKGEHALSTEQIYMLDYQLYTPKSTMYNLFTMLKFDKEQFDMERMAKAMYTVIRNHPALLTTMYYNEDGELVQRYNPDFIEEIKVEKISEFELNELKDHLVMPFKILNAKLYRVRVFETEKSGYIFFDVHHTVFDGTSFKVLMGNVVKAYMGMPLEKDYYYLMLQQREEAIHTPFYEESKKYFEERYNNEEWQTFPKIDKLSRDNQYGELSSELGIQQEEMQAIEKKYKISRNEFFITVAGITISIYNKYDKIRFSWIFNGRESSNMMTSVGLLFRDLPVAFKFKNELKIRDVYADVHQQVQKGIEYNCYPYVELNVTAASQNEDAYLLYQRDIRDVGDFNGMKIETVDIRQNQAASQSVLDIQILDGINGLGITLDYAASRYNDESMESFKELFMRVAKVLLKYNSQEDITIGEIKKEVDNKENIFQKFVSVFSRKK